MRLPASALVVVLLLAGLTFPFTRTRAAPSGFATLAGSRIALTTAGGTGFDTLDVPSIPSETDFTVDAANRFIFAYSHGIGSANATFAQTIGMPRRRSQNP